MSGSWALGIIIGAVLASLIYLWIESGFRPPW